MPTIIIKNTTGSTKNWGGKTYSATSQYTIESVDRDRLLSDSIFLSDLASGFAVVNNGSNDLNSTIGLMHIFGSGEEIRFNNISNGFTATEVQSAIEEVNIGAKLGRSTITTTFNSVIGNNQWLGYNEVLPGNETPIRLPWSCKLREVAVSYNQNNILGIPLSGENIDGQIRIFKNGLTDPTNVVATLQFTNDPGGKIFTGLSISFSAGDYLVSRWIDQGDNPSDMAIMYSFSLY